MSDRDVSFVQRAVRDALGARDRALLAVSGGIDSMVLLHAATVTSDTDRLIVATFDHGTGVAAAEAYELVERTCRARGIRFVGERATRALHSEAELRDARWRFLRGVAAVHGATVATAHTETDQIETVLMRVLRDAGARGMAGLYASSSVVRPLLGLRRDHVAAYAATSGVEWVEDPSNCSRRFLRNRVRHDLLPALRRARPSIESELLQSAREAAAWRRDVEALVADLVAESAVFSGELDVAARVFADRSVSELAIMWPAIAARAGVTLDRRGTARIAAFTHHSRVGSRIQLSGGWEIIRARDAFQLRASADVRRGIAAEALVGEHPLQWGDWSFRPTSEPVGTDAMSARLPVSGAPWVRAWQPGDAMVVRSGGPKRKVKQLLSRAGITGHERMGWPVVLVGDEIVWIPGVRLAEVATARSGRPGLVFLCEHHRR